MTENAPIQAEHLALTPQEIKRLAHLETVIERFRKAYYDTGSALREIRDSRLYRLTHDSFEAYALDKWGISRPRAYELIGASDVAKNLSAVADVSATNEFQLRVLTKLEPEDQIAVYTKAAASAPDGKVTSTILLEKREELLASRPAPKPEPKRPAPAPSKATMVKALDRIKAAFGKQFAAQVDRGQLIANPEDVVAFSRLSDTDLKQVGKLLQQGWKYQEAVGEVSGRLSPDDEIRDLHSKTVQAGGKLRTVVAGFHHVIVSEGHVKELDSRLKNWPNKP